MTTNYTSVKSVLYDLSLTIDERYWNEIKMTEWLVHGLRQMNFEAQLTNKVAQLEVETHKATLPTDLKYIIQVVEYTRNNSTTWENIVEAQDLPENSDLFDNYRPSYNAWRPMRMTSNPYHYTLCLDGSIPACPECGNEYSISPNMVMTTTLRTGNITVAYMGYVTAEDGTIMIPNDEQLKEALLHYVLYRYWMSKYQMKEEGSEQRMRFHLGQWQVLNVKATGNLNSPDVSQMESIMERWNSLVPRDNAFKQMYLN